MTELELLSGARTAAIGMEAVKHGADAVYIGAEKFGARAAAGNSLADIGELIRFAHLFHARVYVTINTILMESELGEARDLICRLYEAGADAILVQDMGILEMDLPPIELHASTQTDNCTPEKVRFLQDAGFSQVVLARECSLADIKAIRAATDVRLEAFVHGALCVSRSGLCYASQAVCSRSANRGECAQICRLEFDMQDGEGHSYGRRHWLSLKDLNLSDHIGEMAASGITSFKIEGRLKDAAYVKNITAYYSRRLNEFIAANPGYRRASDGEVSLAFEPDPRRSFNRGFTTYFFGGKGGQVMSPLTPKSLGMPVGRVIRTVDDRTLEARLDFPVNKQDGLCGFSRSGELIGFKANRAEGGKIFAASAVSGIQDGSALYRNFDAEFADKLSKESAKRTIGISLRLGGGKLSASDGENEVSVGIDFNPPPSEKDQAENIRRQLSKLGGSIYEARSIEIEDAGLFYPSSLLSQLRRSVCAALDEARIASMPRGMRRSAKPETPCPSRLGYEANVSNSLAEKFYRDRGAEEIDKAFELKPDDGAALMRCSHCLRYAVGACRRYKNPDPVAKKNPACGDPMFLISKNLIFRLGYDCARCLMTVSRA